MVHTSPSSPIPNYMCNERIEQTKARPTIHQRHPSRRRGDQASGARYSRVSKLLATIPVRDQHIRGATSYTPLHHNASVSRCKLTLHCERLVANNKKILQGGGGTWPIHLQAALCILEPEFDHYYQSERRNTHGLLNISNSSRLDSVMGQIMVSANGVPQEPTFKVIMSSDF